MGTSRWITVGEVWGCTLDLLLCLSDRQSCCHDGTPVLPNSVSTHWLPTLTTTTTIDAIVRRVGLVGLRRRAALRACLIDPLPTSTARIICISILGSGDGCLIILHRQISLLHSDIYRLHMKILLQSDRLAWVFALPSPLPTHQSLSPHPIGICIDYYIRIGLSAHNTAVEGGIALMANK